MQTTGAVFDEIPESTKGIKCREHIHYVPLNTVCQLLKSFNECFPPNQSDAASHAINVLLPKKHPNTTVAFHLALLLIGHSSHVCAI